MVKDITALQTQCMSSVKVVLGVRTQIPSNLIYVELDIPSVQALVSFSQTEYVQYTPCTIPECVKHTEWILIIITLFIWTCI